MSQHFQLDVEIEIEGVGKLMGRFKRYLAPMTFDELVKRMPLSGVVAVSENAIYMQTEMRRGAEKPAKRAEPGDILYWPPNASIMIMRSSAPAPPQSVKIGSLIDDPAKLSSVSPGSRIIIRQRS